MPAVVLQQTRELAADFRPLPRERNGVRPVQVGSQCVVVLRWLGGGRKLEDRDVLIGCGGKRTRCARSIRWMAAKTRPSPPKMVMLRRGEAGHLVVDVVGDLDATGDGAGLDCPDFRP